MSKISLLMLCVIGIFSLWIFPSGNSEANGSKTDNLDWKVIRPNGWRIPGLNSERLLVDTKEIQLDGITVRREKYKLLGEQLIQNEGFQLNKEGFLTINQGLWALNYISHYSYNDMLFAYDTATMTLVAAVSGYGGRTYVGIGAMTTYVDEDGDGVFEVRYESLSNLKVPNWVLGTATSDVGKTQRPSAQLKDINHKVIRIDAHFNTGWIIPGEAGERKLAVVEKLRIDGMEYQKKTYQCFGMDLFALDDYKIDSSGVVWIEAGYMRLETFTEYLYQGVVFAIEVLLEPRNSLNQKESPGKSKQVAKYLFVKEKKNKPFTVRYRQPERLIIPEWVKTIGRK